MGKDTASRPSSLLKRYLLRVVVLVVLLVLAAGVELWGQGQRAPALRLVRQYKLWSTPTNWTRTIYWTRNGYILAEVRKAPHPYSLVSYDWSGHEIARSNKVAIGPYGRPEVTGCASPDGEWVFLMSRIGTGMMANMTFWHDGRIVRQGKIPACPLFELRGNTVWLFGYSGNTFKVYAIQPNRMLVASDELIMAHSNEDTENHILLSCEIIEVVGAQVPSWGKGYCFSPDGSTLQMSAYRRENTEQSTDFPTYLTYKLRIDGNRLVLRRMSIDPKHKVFSDGRKRIHKPRHASKPPVSIMEPPPCATIGAPSGQKWIIPNWQEYPEAWQCGQSSDGRFALAGYITVNKTGQIALTCDLYEQPGILRAHTALPLKAGDNSKLSLSLPRDGRMQMAIVGKTAYLFSR